MAIRATRRVAHDNHPAFQKAVADDAGLPIVLPGVFDLQRHASENLGSISKIQPTLSQRLASFGRIELDLHEVIVSTKTWQGKAVSARVASQNLTPGR